MKRVVKLAELSRTEIPTLLRAESYFDFEAHPFAHERLFAQTPSVCAAVAGIDAYARDWLAQKMAARERAPGDLTELGPADLAGATTTGSFKVLLEPGALFAPACIIGPDAGTESEAGGTIFVEAGAKVVGADLYVDAGSIYIASGTFVEPCVGIKGPAIIGNDCEIRHGAYLRGDCIIGNAVVLGGELKNAVVMDAGQFPHASYLGDSLCGYATHFGSHATAANLAIYEGMRHPDEWRNMVTEVDGRRYDLGRTKMGLCMGDFSQFGCGAVSDPGTFVGPNTVVYALTRLPKGFYGPNEVLKNKPLQHGVIQRERLRPIA